MGDHYIPQYYLKGFSKNNGKQIWVYGKNDGRAFTTQIKNIANENNFYDAVTEQYLANKVEAPANRVLDKIRNCEKLTTSDKEILSEYIVVMMKRVPKGKTQVNELIPTIATKISQKINEGFNIIASKESHKIQLIKKRRVEIQKILDKYTKQPKQIWLDSIPPNMTPKMIAAISSMTWRFLTYNQSPVFLSCDNPVFYFSGIGIGNPKSEITLPISSHITLWATWRSDLVEGYFPTTTRVVKEINRRTASNTTQYIYHCENEDWVLKFIQRSDWELHWLK
ncbi:MAG: DUF4238 domain-containing protein [bacterium]